MPKLFATLVLRSWIENSRMRRRLRDWQELDPRFARDVGLTSADIEIESGQPFWVMPELSRHGRTAERPPPRHPVAPRGPSESDFAVWHPHSAPSRGAS